MVSLGVVKIGVDLLMSHVMYVAQWLNVTKVGQSKDKVS